MSPCVCLRPALSFHFLIGSDAPDDCTVASYFTTTSLLATVSETSSSLASCDSGVSHCINNPCQSSRCDNMARPDRPISSTPARDPSSAFARSTLYTTQSTPYGALPNSLTSVSDKENTPVPGTVSKNRGKARMAPPTRPPNQNSENTNGAHSAKRIRLSHTQSASRSTSNHGRDDQDERRYYNPDQDPEERQALKRKSRALEREFNGAQAFEPSMVPSDLFLLC